MGRALRRGRASPSCSRGSTGTGRGSGGLSDLCRRRRRADSIDRSIAWRMGLMRSAVDRDVFMVGALLARSRMARGHDPLLSAPGRQELPGGGVGGASFLPARPNNPTPLRSARAAPPAAGSSALSPWAGGQLSALALGRRAAQCSRPGPAGRSPDRSGNRPPGPAPRPRGGLAELGRRGATVLQ